METEDPRKKANPKDAWNHLIKAVTYFIVCKFGYYGKPNSKSVVSKSQIHPTRAARERTHNRAVVSRFGGH
jgi:hypothetical protein